MRKGKPLASLDAARRSRPSRRALRRATEDTIVGVDAGTLEKAPEAVAFRLRGPLGRGVSTFATGFGACLAFLLTPSAGIPAFMVAWFFVVLGAFLFKRRTVVVGVDGLRVGRAPFQRFVDVAKIAEVRRGARWVTVTLQHGARLELPTVDSEHRAMAIEDALHTILRLRDERQGRSFAELARRGRTLREWAAGAHSALGSASGFRREGLSAEGVARALQDPSTPLEQRVGAALALRVAKRADLVRIAANAAAEPRVREILSDLAHEREDEAELIALLDEEASRTSTPQARGRA